MFKDLMAPYVSPLLPVPTPIESENNLRSPIHAVIFDVYGTLFISASGDISNAQTNPDQTKPDQTSPHLTSAINTLLKKYKISLNRKQLNGLVVHAIESDHASLKIKGIDFPEIQIEQIFKQVLQLKDLDVARQFSAEYEMIVNPVYPMPHLRETLQHINTKNIPMGIVSNAQFFTPYLFDLFCSDFPDKLGFDPNLIFYSYEYGVAKPSLFLFKLAAAELTRTGIRPENTLYVGNDMLNDIYTAHITGFQTCLFAGDNRSLRLRKNHPECASLKPDVIIKELNQLTDMIRSS
jgi:putative hydrolase of the HAD superfamily